MNGWWSDIWLKWWFTVQFYHYHCLVHDGLVPLALANRWVGHRRCDLFHCHSSHRGHCKCSPWRIPWTADPHEYEMRRLTRNSLQCHVQKVICKELFRTQELICVQAVNKELKWHGQSFALYTSYMLMGMNIASTWLFVTRSGKTDHFTEKVFPR